MTLRMVAGEASSSWRESSGPEATGSPVWM